MNHFKESFNALIYPSLIQTDNKTEQKNYSIPQNHNIQVNTEDGEVNEVQRGSEKRDLTSEVKFEAN